MSYREKRFFFGHECGDLPMIFTSFTKSQVEIIGKSHHQWQKIVKHDYKWVILYLTCYYMSWTQNSAKTIINHSLCHCRRGRFFVTSPQLICDVTRIRGTSIVTSCSLIVLAHANWRKSNLHKWITTVNIDFSPPSILNIQMGLFSIYALTMSSPMSKHVMNITSLIV